MPKKFCFRTSEYHKTSPLPSSPLPGASASPPARQHWGPPRPDVPREIWRMTRQPKVEKAILLCPTGFPGPGLAL